jgi:myo-inositol-1(or 4)-monophosphatase
MMVMPIERWRKEREIAEKIVRLAGKNIRTALCKKPKAKVKADGSLVSEVDEANNALIIRQLTAAFPGDAILGEEGSSRTISKDRLWIADPLDGTRPFLLRMPISRVGLALVESGQAVLGLIYDPFNDDLWVGQQGQCTTLNGVITTQHRARRLQGARLGVGIFHDTARLVAKLIHEHAEVWNTGCILQEGALVASNGLDGTIFTGPTPWDTAPLEPIIKGLPYGKITGLQGEELRYVPDDSGGIRISGHICASGHELHELLVQAVSRFFLKPAPEEWEELLAK